MWAPSVGKNTIPSKETYGKLNATSYNNPEFDKQRIEPDLLNAFKENPYTQSLSSWA